MSLRTFVSFEAAVPKDGEPPGQELADLLVSGLRDRGVEAERPDEYEGWAWSIGTSFVGGRIVSLVGLTDDPPMEWQVHSYARRGRPRLFGGVKVEHLEARMRDWVGAVDATLREVEGIRSIRWYDQATFEVDHGETWFDRPLD